MEIKEQLEVMKRLVVAKECLIDYTGPLFVFGNIDLLLSDQHPTIISAIMPREEFVILNNRVPNWVNEVKSKANTGNNILVICDMDKISIEGQEILLDILEDNQISTERLPENLKIILHANEKCRINPKIRDIIECYGI